MNDNWVNCIFIGVVLHYKYIKSSIILQQYTGIIWLFDTQSLKCVYDI